MTPEEVRDAVQLLLCDFGSFSHQLGGLEFYGHSPEFCDLLQICGEFSLRPDGSAKTARKAYIFLDAAHGKSSLAKAIAIECVANGTTVQRLDGTAGLTLKELNTLQQKTDVLVIVDGVPDASPARTTLIERINSLKGRAILFARPDYFNDASLKPDIPTVRLAHVDQRQLDKVAWLVGLIREHLRDDSGQVPQGCSDALRKLPLGAFIALCGVPLGSKASDFSFLAKKLAQAVELAVGLGMEAALTEEELATIFIEFHSQGVVQSEHGFRLWVEGESDSRLLKLVCRLALSVHAVDLQEGLSIIPLGEGRDGGTSKATEVVVNRRTRRNKDIFLFDADEPGRHAQAELDVLDQEVLFLDSKIACSRVEVDVEIEDFVNLGCLDRFYAAHPELRPEKEVIRYKPPISRRLVVNGADKELLMQWLEANAGLDDLENLMFMLCEVRSRFSLRNLSAMKDKQSWRRRLVDEFDPDRHFGNRLAHWLVCPTE